MNSYIKTIVEAALAFPFAAFIFTLPYMVAQYRKYGSVLPVRAVIVYSMILYLLCALFLVILPLPSKEEVAAMTRPYTQFVPFMFVKDFVEKSGLVLSQPSTYLRALKSGESIVVIFNILLFVPLGVYSHYYFEKNWQRTLLLGFLLSLFFEITQVTALYGIYPRPYRVFDVDDLILNSFGALCGFWLAGPLAKILPSRDRLDTMSYEKGKRVSLTRRVTAALIDHTLISSICALAGRLDVGIGKLFTVSFLPAGFIAVALFFIVIPILSGGYTPGKAIVKIKLVRADGGRPEFYRYLIRYGILYFLVFPAMVYEVALVPVLSDVSFGVGIIIGIVMAALFYADCLFAVHFIKTGIKKENRFIYEKLSGTHNISTVAEKCVDTAPSV